MKATIKYSLKFIFALAYITLRLTNKVDFFSNFLYSLWINNILENEGISTMTKLMMHLICSVRTKYFGLENV